MLFVVYSGNMTEMINHMNNLYMDIVNFRDEVGTECENILYVKRWSLHIALETA